MHATSLLRITGFPAAFAALGVLLTPACGSSNGATAGADVVAAPDVPTAADVPAGEGPTQEVQADEGVPHPVNGVTVGINPDPDDPHVATITGPQSSAYVYGKKGADGTVTHVDSLVVQQGDTAVTMTLDGANRPTHIGDSTGRVVTFEYGETAVTAHYKGPGGDAETQAIPYAQLPGFPTSAPAGVATQAKGLAFGEQLVRVEVGLSIKDEDGKPLKKVVDAEVTGIVSSKTLHYPAVYDPDAEVYAFSFVHRSVSLDAGRKECLARIAKTAEALRAASLGMAALLSFCLLAGPGAPLCAALTSWGGSFAGLSLAATTGAATLTADQCEAMVHPQDPQQVTVSIAVFHPVLGGRSGSVGYDLTKPDDPVVTSSTLHIDLAYVALPKILDITTIPAAPAAGQSYQFSFSYTPPGASISWSMSGSDGFSTGGEVSGGPTGTTVTSASIPGGKAGVTDTVTAILKVGDTSTDEQKHSFTFH